MGFFIWRLKRRFRNRQLLIIIDRSSHLMPLWKDYDAMACALADRRGRDLCFPVYLLSGPSGNYWDPIGQKELMQMQLPLGSDTIIVSDFGQYGSAACKAAWHALLAHFDHQECVLRTLRIPEKPINFAAVDYLTAAMARMHLPCLQRLRAIRIALADAGIDTGVQDELAVWNHPHRSALSPYSWMLSEAKRKHWLDQFLRAPTEVRQVLESALQAWRKHLAPEASGLEQLLGYQLNLECPPSPHFFDAALAKLRAKGDAAGPAEAWLYAANSLLCNAPRGGRASGYNRLFSAAQRVAESFEQPLPMGLSLLDKAELQEPLRLVEKQGQLVVVGEDQTHECSILDEKGPWLDVAAGCLLRSGDQLQGTELELDGRRFSFVRKHKPSWAKGIGRDGDGPYVETQKGKAYWWPEVVGKELINDRPHGQLAPTTGAWWSHTQCPVKTLNAPKVWPQWAGSGFTIDEYGSAVSCEIEGVALRFRWICPGEFQMGSQSTETGRYSHETQHTVVLTEGYWLAETACTQALWQAVMGENPSDFKGELHPVENVSWQDIHERFIPALNKLVPGADFCLPTEAQWEYACRAGSDSAFHWGDELSYLQARYGEVWDYDQEDLSGSIGKAHEALRENGRYGTAEVKVFEPNAWGLYQMHGNVHEWCGDGFDDLSSEAVCDPQGAPGALKRVLRGGSWLSRGRYLRSAYRSRSVPDYRVFSIGFRLAQVPSEH